MVGFVWVCAEGGVGLMRESRGCGRWSASMVSVSQPLCYLSDGKQKSCFEFNFVTFWIFDLLIFGFRLRLRGWIAFKMH